MADKYIIGGRCSGKSYMTLNTIEVLLENKKLKEALKAKEQECEELKKTVMLKCPQCGEVYLNPIGSELYEENVQLKQTLTEIKKIAEIRKDDINDWLAKEILQKCEVLDGKNS